MLCQKKVFAHTAKWSVGLAAAWVSPCTGPEPQPLLLLESVVASQSLLTGPGRRWGDPLHFSDDASLPWGMGVPGLGDCGSRKFREESRSPLYQTLSLHTCPHVMSRGWEQVPKNGNMCAGWWDGGWVLFLKFPGIVYWLFNNNIGKIQPHTHSPGQAHVQY